jgi:hypothetical protein
MLLGGPSVGVAASDTEVGTAAVVTAVSSADVAGAFD